MSDEVKSITVIAGDYPAPGHMRLVFVQQLVHAIMSEGVKVNVVAPQSLTHAFVHRESLFSKHDVVQTEFGRQYNVYRPYTISFGNYNLFKKFSNWYNSRAIRKILKRIGGDVLYAHFWSSAQLVYDYALKTQTPLFVACGEGDNALEGMIATMSKSKLVRMVNAVTGVISVSSENKRKCVDYNLALAENIEVFPNCVNISIFHRMDATSMRRKLGINEGDFVISFVGGFIPRKGPDRIAQAIKNLKDPTIKVIFIGKTFDGYPYNFDCPGIIHKGPLDHDLIPMYVNCSDVFVMPTQKEGCCNAIVEALAMGIPIISSNLPFNDDILDDRNSIRIDPNDVDAITNAIRRLRDDKELRHSMTEYSLSRRNEYSIQERAKRIIAFINKQVNKLSCSR